MRRSGGAIRATSRIPISTCGRWRGIPKCFRYLRPSERCSSADGDRAEPGTLSRSITAVEGSRFPLPSASRRITPCCDPRPAGNNLQQTARAMLSRQHGIWDGIRSVERSDSVDIHLADNWRQVYLQASIGILAMDNVANPPEHAALDEHAYQVEADLRSQWAGATRADVNRLPEFEAYRSYYRRFNKTYPVQLQFESVVFKGKALRSNG